jgi:hypothetical protein
MAETDRGVLPSTRGSPARDTAPEESAARDEAAASMARRQYRAVGMTPLDADARIAGLLRSGERIFATRSPAFVSRRPSPDGPIAPRVLKGDLYLTSERLIATGPTTVEADLEAIEEAVISGDQLLLVMHDGVGLLVEVDQPRLMRVQIAAARAGALAPDADRSLESAD